MAVDGALLAAAQTPTLRLYGWAPHAVSIGYFQSVTDFVSEAAETRFGEIEVHSGLTDGVRCTPNENIQ